MPESICVLVCGHFLAEAEAVCQTTELQRVRVDSVPSRCGRPCLSWAELEAKRQRPDEPLVVFGGLCLGALDEAEARSRGMVLHRTENCQEMLLNVRMLQAFLSQGAYVLTPGWVAHWRAHLEEQGTDAGLVRELWRESISSLLLLDTGVGEPEVPFQELIAYLGLPGEILPLGLDHFQLLLERAILEARLRLEKARAEGSVHLAQRQAADRATALEFLGALSHSLKEADVIQGIVNLFRMLFHAEQVAFLPRGDEGVSDQAASSYLETDQGFLVPIATSVGLAGHLRVEGLAFPQFKTHYLNLAISMAGVCALALQNAQTYRVVEESRAYQRLVLDVLDVFYQPRESEEDVSRVLGYLQSFAGVDALALRLRDQERFAIDHRRGYPSAFTDLSCSRCLDDLAGGQGRAPAGAQRSTRGSLWINDLPAGDPACPCEAMGFRSVALVQLKLRGGVAGIIQLHHRQPGHFSPVLIERLEGVARSIGIGLERRWAEADLRRANRELESRVEQRTTELAHINQELRQEILERTRAEAHLETRSVELQVRLKELHCLYELSNLFEEHEGQVEVLGQRAIDLVPGGFSHPERTWGRLRLDDRAFCSADFREGPSCLKASLTINGEARGSLEVYADPDPDAPAFLVEEQELVKSIADLIQGLVDHVEVEADNRRVEQALLQSQKLEALGTLAGGIAHDFNNALTPIIALADLSLMKLGDESPLRRHLELIKVSGNRAKDLVDQILLFSRKQPPSLQALDLRPTLQEVLRLIRATLPSTIEIQEELHLEEGLVLGDPTQIHQIVMNLCTNASHAMQEGGGTLTVRLLPHQIFSGDDLCTLGLAPGHYAQLEVADTGKGMTPELQARIFEPFFTTKGVGKGTGMGLAVVHGIVTSYHGHISVYSEPGQGTTFRIYLPITREGGAAQAGPVNTTDTPRGAEQILVVDDEPSIRQALSALLQTLGYRTLSAEGGAQALERLRDEAGGVDLILTDMTMPKMTGLELAHQVHAQWPGLPVVLCSGFSDQISAEGLRAEGIREFVHKPFTAAQVAGALRRELDREG